MMEQIIGSIFDFIMPGHYIWRTKFE